jgi:hypothetical protein
MKVLLPTIPLLVRGVVVRAPSVVLILSVLLLIVPNSPTEAIELTIDTQIPEYILGDNLNLTGTYTSTISTLTEDANSHFNRGALKNVTVSGGNVTLKPTLDITMLNNGNPVLRGGPSSSWDPLIWGGDVIKVNRTYYLFYAGGRTDSLDAYKHIGFATSTDGVSFTRFSGNPIIKSRVDSYDRTCAYCPVVYYDGTWHMWYASNDGGKQANQDIDTSYAYSSDGGNWTKYSNNPVINNGNPNNVWDGVAIRPFGFIKDNNNMKLYLAGNSFPVDPSMGHATSTDAKNWVKSQNNPIYSGNPNGWDDGEVRPGTVEKANGTYRMWMAGDKGVWNIGWIWSKDGTTWVDSGAALIRPTVGTIYSRSVANPKVIDEGDHYKIYAHCYNGVKYNVGCFKAVPKKLDGRYTSKLFDMGGIVRVINTKWTYHKTAAGELTMEFRFGNSSTALSPWIQMNTTNQFKNVTARYFKYRASFKVPKDWMRISLKKFEMNFEAPVASVGVSVDGSPWENATWQNDSWWYNASLHDGDYNIRVRGIDSRGREVMRTVPVKVDLFPPTGNMTLEEGRWATNSTSIFYSLAAKDTHGVPLYMISLDPAFSGFNWSDFVVSGIFSYGGLDGNVTVYAIFMDGAERVSAVVNDSIIVDTTPPEGSLIINDEEPYTNSSQVMLDLDWSDLTGVVDMQVSNDPDFTNATWMDPTKRLVWTLDDLEGNLSVYVRIRDAVGWITTVNDTIILDRIPPVASVVINSNATYTSSRDVSLNVTISDANPMYVKFANIGDDWPIGWQTLEAQTTMPWILATGDDGPREVRMLVRDAGGNEVTVADDIILDTVPPDGSLTLQDGAEFTSNLLVMAHLDYSDATSGIAGMRTSITGDFSEVQWQTIKGEFSWFFPAGDGQKTLFVQIIDRAGNIFTVEDSIILDTTAPTGHFIIGEGLPCVTEPSVTLLMGFSDGFGVAQMRVSNHPDFGSSDWEPYKPSVQWSLTDVEGKHTVYMQVRDSVGNTYHASTTTTLDLNDPVATIVIEGGVEATLDLIVNLEWTAEDSIGLEAFRFSSSPDFQGVDWELWASIPEDGPLLQWYEVGWPYTLLEGDGLKTVYLQVKDVTGRTVTMSDDIWYVSSRPEGALIIGDGSGWTNVTGITVAVQWTGGSQATHYRVATIEDGLGSVPWTRMVVRSGLTLPGSSGVKSVYAELLGPHNVTSLLVTGEVTLDLDPPTLQFISPVKEVTESDSVLLNLSIVDDLDPNPSVKWRINGGEWKLYEGPVDLRLKEGGNIIEVEAKDAAGNGAMGTWEIEFDVGFEVGSPSFIFLLLVVIAVPIGVWYWYKKRGESEQG